MASRNIPTAHCVNTCCTWHKGSRPNCHHDVNMVPRLVAWGGWRENKSLQGQLEAQFSPVAQSTLCDSIDYSTPGPPVHHQLLDITQTHVHWVGDAIQPSHPLSSPSPPTFNLSQHQGLFKWVSSSNEVTKSTGVSASASVLPMNLQDWSPLGWTGWISLQSKGLSRVFSRS